MIPLFNVRNNTRNQIILTVNCWPKKPKSEGTQPLVGTSEADLIVLNKGNVTHTWEPVILLLCPNLPAVPVATPLRVNKENQQKWYTEESLAEQTRVYLCV